MSVVTKEEQKETRRRVAKPMLYVGIVSIVMLFAGLTSAYIVRQAEGNWLVFPFPATFYISTVLILLSSATMFLAQRSIKKDEKQKTKQFLLVTLMLGIGFVVSQFIAWDQLTDNGVFFTGPTANASGSFLYVLSGMHLVHLLAGVLALGVTYFKASAYKYSASNALGIELCGIYWHFLDILWLYLLLFLLFIR